jgi:ribokinase
VSRIVVVGSLNADLVVGVERFPAAGETLTGRDFAVFGGGKGANQAVAAARLGAAVAMVGCVGGDAYGGWLRDGLRADGVDVAHVESDVSVSSGVAVITIDASGQNEIVVVPGANGRLTEAVLERHRTAFASAAYVLLQLEVPLDTVAAAARLGREAGAVVVLDPAPARADALALLPTADYLPPNETELAALVGVRPEAFSDLPAVADAARALLARGAGRVVAKLGPRGALLVGPGLERHWPAPRVDAVDTTAAGDVWNGAFAAALAAGRSVDEAGGLATAAAALSVTRKGAQPSMPRGNEVPGWTSGRNDKGEG